MFNDIFGSYDGLQITILILSAILIGINKTALPGIGVLPVIMLSNFFDPRLSTGLQLLMLAMADLIAVAYYRRSADWKIILRLLPWALIGIAFGSLTLRFVTNEQMRPLLGLIILFLALLSFLRNRISGDRIPSGWTIGILCGLLLGFTTQVANAAGPVAAIYFLAMRLSKEKYMGCSAWFFLILNWTKLPIFTWEGRITVQSLKMDLCMIPFLLLGGFLGIVILAKLPQKYFEWAIQILVIAGAIKMLI